jgi:hypothetical protein
MIYRKSAGRAGRNDPQDNDHQLDPELDVHP